MKYFISAGEASGDLHAAALIGALRAVEPEARFTFLGGDLMAAAASSEPLIHYRRMAFMGFSEVLRHLSDIRANLRCALQALEQERPDCLVLVDYPSFNLKLARRAKALGIPVCWYISPKVWAWKEYRVRSLRRYVDCMLCILPFEVEFYRRHGMEVTYVGNPSLEEVDRKLAALPSHELFCASHLIDVTRPILALVPGSRVGEIRNNLPIMAAVAARHPDLDPVIAAAPGIDEELYVRYAPGIRCVAGDTFALMANSVAALVTSGTATLECALIGTPQVVCYRANGSRLSYSIMHRLLHVDYVSLPNLIADALVIPEMLVHLCTVDSVDAELSAILPGKPGRAGQIEGYARMRRRLGVASAAATAAQMIARLAHEHRK